VPIGKAVLKVNLDETSVCLFQGDRKGNVFLSKRRVADVEPVQRVPRGRRRSCMTHIAFICDRQDIQPLLPQVIVGNEATFPAAAFGVLQAACPANVRLVRQRSAWNNEMLCAIVVRILALALRPFMHEFQPILLLDAVRLHTARAVLAACSACGIWLVLVPAKATWLLQPLDTHAFQRYKEHLRRAYQRARVDTGRSDLTIGEFLACVYDTIRCVLQGHPWAGAFNMDGFGNLQADLSAYVKRQLGSDLPLPLPTSRPSLDQLELCFPRRAIVPVPALWRPFDPRPLPKALPSVPLRRSLAPPAPVGRLGRTRADHRMALEATEAKAVSQAAATNSGSAVVARALRLPRAKALPVAIGL
jgi:hypothetical protein